MSRKIPSENSLVLFDGGSLLGGMPSVSWGVTHGCIPALLRSFYKTDGEHRRCEKRVAGGEACQGVPPGLRVPSPFGTAERWPAIATGHKKSRPRLIGGRLHFSMKEGIV